MYNRLLDAIEKDVGTWVETWEKWQSGDKVVRTQCRENDIMEHVNAAKATKAHEEEVYGKFSRLRERFILNPKKLADSIVAYRRYLQVRLQHHEDAILCESAVTSGAFSFDEMMAARKEIMIIMEENERKLDILLTE
jgi:E3 ubiquitin-protein ligase DOA10